MPEAEELRSPGDAGLVVETPFGAVRRVLVALGFMAVVVWALLFALGRNAGWFVNCWLGAYLLAATFVSGELTRGAVGRLSRMRGLDFYLMLFSACHGCLSFAMGALIRGGRWSELPWLLLFASVTFLVLALRLSRCSVRDLEAPWEPPRPSLFRSIPWAGWLKQTGRSSLLPFLAVIEILAFLSLAVAFALVWIVVEVGVGLVGAMVHRLASLVVDQGPARKRKSVVFCALASTSSSAALGVAAAALWWTIRG